MLKARYPVVLVLSLLGCTSDSASTTAGAGGTSTTSGTTTSGTTTSGTTTSGTTTSGTTTSGTGSTSASTGTGKPATSPYPLWMLNGPGNEAEAMATDPNGIAFFGQSGVQVFYPIVHDVPPPKTWNVILFKKYASYAQFSTDVMTQAISPKDAAVVVYDNESWAATPADEQADPIQYAKMFAALAHKNGFEFMNTPAEDLMGMLSPGQNKYLAFIQYGYATAVAPVCDYYQIQGQQIENDTTGDSTMPSFNWYVEQLAAQARAANPKVVVIGGVVAKAGYTSMDIVSAVDSTIGVVSGQWLNILCNLDCASGSGLTATQSASAALAKLMTEHP